MLLSSSQSGNDSQPAVKFEWGDLELEDDDSLDFLLPPRQVIGPGENGINKVIEYSFNNEGKRVKTTTTIRTRRVVVKKQVAERRSWAKFGDAVDEDVSAMLTVVSKDEIKLERPKAPGQQQEEPKVIQTKGNTSGRRCRVCQGDHFTAFCPNKDLASELSTTVDTPPPNASNIYVPPRSRASWQRNVDENPVQFNNLSEDAREDDLRELVQAFGEITRVYVAKDRKTGSSRGFGFVNFARREDAQKAINKLDGYGYDNLILKVEWAPPKAR